MRGIPLTTGKSQFYYKIITFTLLLSLLPIIVAGIVFYQNAKTTMQRELLQANTNYLVQTVNAVELIIKQITRSFSQLAMEGTATERFEQFPRGLYFETLTGELMEEDLPSLQSYLLGKKQVFQNLRTLKLSNEFISSVYYFDNTKQLIMTSDLLQYTPEDFYDKEWNSYPKKDVHFPIIMDIRSSKQKDGQTVTIIPLVYRTSVDGNFLVINLDADTVYGNIANNLESRAENAFFVLSSSGRLMLHDKSNVKNEEIGFSRILQQEFVLAGGHPSFEGEYGGKQMLVNGMRSDLLGWTFVTATPLDKLYRSVSYIKGLTILISMLLVVAAGLLALLTARNIYAPLVRLLQFITIKDGALGSRDGAGRIAGEWQLIRTSLEKAFEDRESLTNRLKESMPAYKETFVRSLLRKNRYSPDLIRERLHYLGIGIQSENLLLLAVSLEEDKDKQADSELAGLNKLLVTDAILRALPAEWPRVVTEVAEGLFIAIVNGGALDLPTLFSVAEKAICEIEDCIGVRGTIGIGRPCTEISRLGETYEEALEALRYRIIAGRGEVIYIEDVRLAGTPLLVYPKEKEESLMNYVVNGKSDEAHRVFAAWVQDVRAQQGTVHYRQVQHAFMQLLGSIIATTGRMRLDLNQLLEEKSNLYGILLQKNDWQEAITWFNAVIAKLANQFANAFREKYTRHVDQAIEMMVSALGQPVSLTAIAERLQLNPSYLSRIFKEQTGEPFTEFLTRMRMEKGKALLLESNYKVKEIGEQVGYQKTDYFIRLFKEHTGMTPGEYRQSRRLSS